MAAESVVASVQSVFTPEVMVLVQGVLSGIVTSGILLIAKRYEVNKKSSDDFRKFFIRHYCMLAGNLHQIVAIPSLALMRLEREQNIDKYTELYSSVKDSLEKNRRELRYVLSGIDDGLRTITRTYSWVMHKKKDLSKSKEIIESANELRNALDLAIIETYNTGKPPSKEKVDEVKKCVANMRDIYGENDSSVGV
ncbi:MAG TPA: hypothetical protein VE028_00980 [Nitratidesulfovibrio sp.]|nr:hypothetical protein [Nitratidesulfovibrio sp.]